MSTGHPLTEEQLDALVDELQDRLGDSTARKVGRRGVLAALGLATLGTGSASAQASGSVGTSSSPVDVEGYDVSASNSFTDPAGVQHTGELADISDVGGGAEFQEVNSGSNLEPIDGETIGTGVEDVDVGTVITGATAGAVGEPVDRPLISNSSETVAVPGDEPTVQDAVNGCPLLLRHDYTIDIDPAHTENEDIFVPPVIGSEPAQLGQGTSATLTIRSADAAIAKPSIGSILVQGAVGGSVSIANVEITKDAPVNENFGIAIMHSNIGQIFEVDFNGPTNGILCYGGRALLDTNTKKFDIGSGLDRFLRTKKDGRIVAEGSAADFSGSCNVAAEAQSGEIVITNGMGVSTSGRKYNPKDGIIIDHTNERLHGITEFVPFGETKFGFQINQTTSAPPAPDEGFVAYRDANQSPPQLVLKDEFGNTSTVTSW